jgi:hypothetical protein
MTTWNEWEKQQLRVLEAKEEIDRSCLRCPKCDGQWFEEVKVTRYKEDHNVVVGQQVPARPGSIPYIVLRCIRCNDVLEPRVVHSTRDIAGGDYDKFLDCLEGLDDKRNPKKSNEPSKPREKNYPLGDPGIMGEPQTVLPPLKGEVKSEKI